MGLDAGTAQLALRAQPGPRVAMQAIRAGAIALLADFDRRAQIAQRLDEAGEGSCDLVDIVDPNRAVRLFEAQHPC